MQKYLKALSLAATYGGEIIEIYQSFRAFGTTGENINRLRMLISVILKNEFGIDPKGIING